MLNQRPPMAKVSSFLQKIKHKFLILGILFFLVLGLFGIAFAQIGISQHLEETYTILAVTGNPDTSKHEVQARLLSYTDWKTLTVPTTGPLQHQPAQAGGMLEINNGSPTGVTIPANAQFAYQDLGTFNLFETDVPVYVPPGSVNGAGIATSYGTTSVSAHAAQIGNSGNIPKGSFLSVVSADWVGTLNISATSIKAFTGGYDEHQNLVLQKDINSAVDAITRTGYSKQMLQNHMNPNERIVREPTCKQKVVSVPAVGGTAANVTVTVNYTCANGIVYDQDEALSMAANFFREQTLSGIGSMYKLTGKIVTAVINATVIDTHQGIIKLTVSAEGTRTI